MKIILLIATGFLILAGCNGGFENKPVNVSGTYFSAWASEFAEVRDTIQIKFIQPGECKITRRTYVAKNYKPEYKLVHWTGTYNEKDKTIVIHDNGRILYFKDGEMKMGTTIYQKL